MAKGKVDNGGENGLTFESLLEAATIQHEVNPDILNEKGKLEGERAKLQDELDKINAKLKEVESKAQAPIKAAIKAAAALGIEVPEAYRGQVRNSNGEKSEGKWSFRSGDRVLDAVSVSRALWFLSEGCDGSNKGGRLTSEEFWTLVKAQTGKDSFKAGDNFMVTLPNEKEVEASKIA